MDKRTQAQLDFDMAKHGWAFCNKATLQGKVDRMTELAKALRKDDKRWDILATIKERLEAM